MILSPQAAVAIAQTTLFGLFIPLTIYSSIRNWNHHPRRTWIPLVIFAGSGIITIFLELNGGKRIQDSNALSAASSALLGVGLVLLMSSAMSLLRVITADNPGAPQSIAKFERLATVGYAIALILLVGGPCLVFSTRQASIGRILVAAGYVVLAILLVALIIMHGVLLRRRGVLTHYWRTVLSRFACAIPLLIVRMVYALIYNVVDATTRSILSPLTGSVISFGVMCLLMEWITLYLYTWFGMTVPPPQTTWNFPGGQTTDYAVNYSADPPYHGADGSRTLRLDDI